MRVPILTLFLLLLALESAWTSPIPDEFPPRTSTNSLNPELKFENKPPSPRPQPLSPQEQYERWQKVHQTQQRQQAQLRREMHAYMRQQQQQQAQQHFIPPEFLQAQQQYMQEVLKQQQQQQLEHMQNQQRQEQRMEEEKKQAELGEPTQQVPALECSEQTIVDGDPCPHEGQRCPLDSRKDGFVVCDQGNWRFMECAPGTAYGPEAQVCVDPVMASYISRPKENNAQPNENGYSDSPNEEPKIFQTLDFNDDDQAPASKAEQNIHPVDQTVVPLPGPSQAKEPPSQDDWQAANPGQVSNGKGVGVNDAKEIVYPTEELKTDIVGLVITGVCELGAIEKVQDDPYSYSECVYNDLNSTDWIKRPCPNGAMFNPTTLNCGYFSPSNDSPSDLDLDQLKGPGYEFEVTEEVKRGFTGPTDGPAELWFGSNMPEGHINVKGQFGMQKPIENNQWVNGNNIQGNANIHVQSGQTMKWVVNPQPPVQWLDLSANGNQQPQQWPGNTQRQNNPHQLPVNNQQQLPANNQQQNGQPKSISETKPSVPTNPWQNQDPAVVLPNTGYDANGKNQDKLGPINAQVPKHLPLQNSQNPSYHTNGNSQDANSQTPKQLPPLENQNPTYNTEIPSVSSDGNNWFPDSQVNSVNKPTGFVWVPDNLNPQVSQQVNEQNQAPVERRMVWIADPEPVPEPVEPVQQPIYQAPPQQLPEPIRAEAYVQNQQSSSDQYKPMLQEQPPNNKYLQAGPVWQQSGTDHVLPQVTPDQTPLDPFQSWQQQNPVQAWQQHQINQQNQELHKQQQQQQQQLYDQIQQQQQIQQKLVSYLDAKSAPTWQPDVPVQENNLNPPVQQSINNDQQPIHTEEWVSDYYNDQPPAVNVSPSKEGAPVRVVVEEEGTEDRPGDGNGERKKFTFIFNIRPDKKK